jgi:hypothetical protein
MAPWARQTKLMEYPKLASKADQLLFDLGFSYGLISEAKQLLESIEGFIPDEVLQKRVSSFLERIDELEKGRLNVRAEIYDNATAAAAKGWTSITSS